ncbi:sel1 repeat family protein [Pseudomonas sp. P66]|uniref:Sel1 repeat family protein n=1 Tax=Pseudomonas arcuscaelestis TaxID=2710591 RepID=A0ABS2BUB2_9PSED|nr:tetratricopeptide repeat protein [Pseudomonas arcuscaelestis]MBM3108427.1 sel1 repeat family protein [Pseudomonas arcuscaelestis]MBM3112772.1 sel1 repeat family protein [Pseudomonas arcuscaelestis]MBM5457212.1 sel1 repeat family protein [Pseudomonas arcuscaelestis]
MSAASNIYPLLERLLPERITPVSGRAGQLERMYAGVGMPSQRAALGESFILISRLEEASDLQALYSDLRSQALDGSVAALNDLGWIWLNGKYWRADTPLAGHLLRMAALQGSAVAWFNLGQQYYFGKGVEVAYASAAEYYQHAFERGLEQAAAALGDLYEEEICDGDLQTWRVDLQMAYSWFSRGAQSGEARCRFEVGYRLLHGQSVAADHKAGVYWLELAAVAGVMQAAEELAVHFSVSNDALRYLFWRDQAIHMGSSLALTMKLDDQLQPGA